MSEWTVQVAISTTRRVDGSTVAALLAGSAACRAVRCSPGAPGASVLLGVQAATDADAYGAALLLLVADVLPWLEGATLIDVRIALGGPSPVRADGPAPPAPTTGRDDPALV